MKPDRSAARAAIPEKGDGALVMGQAIADVDCVEYGRAGIALAFGGQMTRPCREFDGLAIDFMLWRIADAVSMTEAGWIEPDILVL